MAPYVPQGVIRMVVSKLNPALLVIGCALLSGPPGAFADPDSTKAEQACAALSGLHISASAIGLRTTGARVEKANFVAAGAGSGNSSAEGVTGSPNAEYC